MALTFGAKSVKLAKVKKFLFDVSRKDYSSEKKMEKSRRSPKSFHVQRDKATLDKATNSTTKTKQNNAIKGCTITTMSEDIWLRIVCDQSGNGQKSLQHW